MDKGITTREIRKYCELNEKEHKTLKIYGIKKKMVRKKSKAINAYVRKVEEIKTNDVGLHIINGNKNNKLTQCKQKERNNKD